MAENVDGNMKFVRAQSITIAGFKQLSLIFSSSRDFSNHILWDGLMDYTEKLSIFISTRST